MQIKSRRAFRGRKASLKVTLCADIRFLVLAKVAFSFLSAQFARASGLSNAMNAAIMQANAASLGTWRGGRRRVLVFAPSCSYYAYI